MNRFIVWSLCRLAQILISTSAGMHDLAGVLIGIAGRRVNCAGLRVGFDKTIKRY